MVDTPTQNCMEVTLEWFAAQCKAIGKTNLRPWSLAGRGWSAHSRSGTSYYFGVLFTSVGRVEREIDKSIKVELSI